MMTVIPKVRQDYGAIRLVFLSVFLIFIFHLNFTNHSFISYSFGILLILFKGKWSLTYTLNFNPPWFLCCGSVVWFLFSALGMTWDYEGRPSKAHEDERVALVHTPRAADYRCQRTECGADTRGRMRVGFNASASKQLDQAQDISKVVLKKIKISRPLYLYCVFLFQHTRLTSLKLGHQRRTSEWLTPFTFYR